MAIKTTKLFIVIKSLERLRRSVGITKDARIPISHELFSKIIHSLPHICNSAYESALFLAAFTLTYFGLLRVSETLALQCKDIKIKANLLCQITIQKSKTDQIGFSSVVDITPHPTSSISPIETIKSYLGLRGNLSLTHSLLTHLNS